MFRRVQDLSDPDRPGFATSIYVNTNKTADSQKDGPAKGYELPWPFLARDASDSSLVHRDLHYWIEKLRDWQEKYNPIDRPTLWDELEAAHIDVKSDVQLAGFPPTCFLFREPAHKGCKAGTWRDADPSSAKRRLPLTDALISRAWFEVLAELESRLARVGQKLPDGEPIILVDRSRATSIVTHFPLHSLRVSLITALAIDGGMEFPLLQKIVGHSRLLMTLYYVKPGAVRLQEALITGLSQLERAKDSSLVTWLKNESHERLEKEAIANSVDALKRVLPAHPADRNAAGWTPMHHGLCLVGGNTSGLESKNVGGCHNGGESLGIVSGKPKHGPVPGGSRNCVRCRWFVTSALHIKALVAHFNNVSYRWCEARDKALALEEQQSALEAERYQSELSGRPFASIELWKRGARNYEAAVATVVNLGEDLVACWTLIQRCMRAASEGNDSGADGGKLIAVGASEDIKTVLETTDSELL